MLVVRLTDEPAALLPQLRVRVAQILAEPHVGELLLERGGFDPGIVEPLRAALAASGAAAAARYVSEEIIGAFALLGGPERLPRAHRCVPRGRCRPPTAAASAARLRAGGRGARTLSCDAAGQPATRGR